MNRKSRPACARYRIAPNAKPHSKAMLNRGSGLVRVISTRLMSWIE